MIGKPKFKYEENVTFQFGEQLKKGTIYIIDEYGTWDDRSDVSYDIMSTTDDGRQCLFKHINEKYVKPI